MTVSLAITTAQNTIGAGTDTLTSIENLTGSGFDDALTGSSTVNVLTGGVGNDTLNGGSGADTMVGGIGNDIYVVDNTGDVVAENPGEGTDTVQSSVTYTLSANVEKLTMTGTSAINGTGNNLNNVIIGNGGNNTLAGLGGADSLDGGAGIDTASYATSDSAVTVSLMTGTGSGGDAGGDTLVNIENLTDQTAMTRWRATAATMYSTAASGTDTASYEHATAGVTVSLALTTSQNTVGAGSDTLTSVENLTGSAFNDTLIGNSRSQCADRRRRQRHAQRRHRQRYAVRRRWL